VKPVSESPTKTSSLDFASPLDLLASKGGANSEFEEFRQRGSSFKGTNFEKLAENDQEEKDLDSFFMDNKLFLVFTHAGKPVYSS
jgi:hypothetical protein